MKHRSTAVLGFLLSAGFMGNAALAASQADIDLCGETVTRELPKRFAGAELKIRSISPSVKVKIRYRMTYEGERYTVVCTIGRRSGIAVTWPRDAV